MNAQIVVDGKPYIPIAAVPFVTGGFLTIGNVADMIANPESFCDHHCDTILSAFKVTTEGRLVQVHYRAFQLLVDSLVSKKPVPAPELTAGIVVPEADLKTLLLTLVHELSAVGKLGTDRPPASWDINPALPRSVETEIRDSIRTPLNRTASRKNSKEAKKNRILDAVNHTIEPRAVRDKVPFDRQNMLGHKRDFLKLVAKVDPKASVSEENFNRHYAAHLGLRWRQGSKRNDAGPLLALFGMTVT